MMANWIRFFHKDNATLIDYSLASQNKSENIVLPVVYTEDALFIGQYMPFNNIFFEVKVANDVTSAMQIYTHNGNQWEAVVDIIDETSTGGKTLAKSGVVQWTVNKNKNWQLTQDTTSGNQAPIELSSLTIYDMYWIKITFTASLKATTAIDRLTYKFTDESVLGALDPDLSQYMTSWSSSKTDWLDQILVASERVWLDLKAAKIIKGPESIMRFDEIHLATAWKTLALIYSALGKEYTEKRDYAEKQYSDILNNLPITVDMSEDGHLNRNEISSSKAQVVR